jgi:uncharacterized protein (DUF58 family)
VLTPSGLGAVLCSMIAIVLGWWWGYEEVVLGGVAIGLLVILAVWSSRRPLRATIERQVLDVRLPRGDPIRLTYRLANESRFRSGAATIVDTCDGQTCRVRIPPLPADSVERVNGAIPTTRRGVFDVGPFEIERIDPFWLSVGSRRDRATSPVTVHPRIYDLHGPTGSARVIENESVLRRTVADPMSGFVSMREYVPGDDPRLIHWPTTAHTGQLMVREHVEVRRPEFTVVLDTAEGSTDADDFEEAVDVAATLAVHAIRSGLDVVMRTTSTDHPGTRLAVRDDRRILDLLTPVTQTSVTDTLPVVSLFSSGFDHTSVIMVTGPRGPSGRAPMTDRFVTVRIGAGAATDSNATFAAEDAREFVRRWQGLS